MWSWESGVVAGGRVGVLGSCHTLDDKKGFNIMHLLRTVTLIVFAKICQSPPSEENSCQINITQTTKVTRQLNCDNIKG